MARLKMFSLAVAGLVLNFVGATALDFDTPTDCRWRKLEKFIRKPNTPEEAADKCNAIGCNIGGVAKMRCWNAKETQNPSTYKAGFYFEDDTDGSGLVFKCTASGWEDEFGGTQQNGRLPKCKPGCVKLNDWDMRNATYKGTQPKTYYNGKEAYWTEGVIVETVCKEGYMFTDDEYSVMGYDKHICDINVGSGWRELDKQNNGIYGWPAKCEAYCNPLDTRDYPNSIKPINNPENQPNEYRKLPDGRVVMRPQTTYQFRCKEGYNYLPPHDVAKQQNLICLGKDVGYVDLATSKSLTKPTPCVSEGCTPITSVNLYPNNVVTTGIQCGSSEDSQKDGCTVSIKCSKNVDRSTGLGYYSPDAPNGLQLTCSKGKWTDASGSEVKPDQNGKFGGECKAGCNKMTGDQLTSTELIKESAAASGKNEDLTFYPTDTTVDTKCKDNYIRPGLIPQPSIGLTHRCTETGWKNTDSSQSGNNVPSSCVAACLVPATVTGTKVSVSGTQTTKDGKSYVQKGAVISLICDDKFKAPEGSSPEQTLTCDGGSNGWKDSNGKTNVAPLTCIRDGAIGCQLVSPENNPTTDVVTSGNCNPVGGLLPEDCKITVKCKEGFIPSSETPVDNASGEQKLTCKAGNDGYVDESSGSKNAKPMKCEKACPHVTQMDSALFVRKADPSKIRTYAGKQFVLEGTEVDVKCRPRSEGFAATSQDDLDDERLNGFITYRCRGGDELYIKPKTSYYRKLPGDCCGGVCTAILPNQNIKVQEFFSPDHSSMVFTQDFIKMAVNMYYNITCQAGYEYPKGSPESDRGGKQNLHCIGGETGYVDVDTGLSKAKATACVKMEEAKCPALAPMLNHEVATNEGGNCDVVGGKQAVGCIQKIECKKSYFPSVISAVAPQNPQIVKCVLNQEKNTATWMNAMDNNPTSLLKCSFGCTAAIGPGAEKVAGPEPTDSHYKDGDTVSVRCKTGYVPKISNISPTMSYQCGDHTDGKPWKNNGAQTYEPTLGSICVRTCPKLNSNSAGLTMISSPQETATMSGMAVIGGGKYVFSCIEGYEYPKSTPYGPANTQELYCNELTGQYMDLTNNNNTATSPAQCARKEGPGCNEIPKANTVIDLSQCPQPYKTGCKITVKCLRGFYPTETPERVAQKQELTCEDGKTWKESNGRSEFKYMTCEPMCHYDKSQLAPNVKIRRQTLESIVDGNDNFISSGFTVIVDCVGTYTLWETEEPTENIPHQYTCVGGQGFTRDVDKKLNARLGDGCIDSCDPMPQSVLQGSTINHQPPKLYTIDGQDGKFIRDKDQYVFTCKDKFAYPPDTPFALAGRELAVCNGTNRQWQYVSTGATFVKPTECVRKQSNNECPILAQDSASTIVTTVTPGKCAPVDEKYVNSGCSYAIQCKSNYKPTSPLYLTKTGTQDISCQSGGNGWTDQFGNTITEPLECVPGCVDPVRKPPNGSQTTFTYDYKDKDSKDQKSQCDNVGETIDYTSHPYFCPWNSKYNLSHICTNACYFSPANLTNGVEVVKAGTFGEAVNDFIGNNLEVILQCKRGFVYPSDTIYKKLGKQSLLCDGTTAKFTDTDTKEVNPKVQECEEVKGCTALETTPTTEGPTEINKCYKFGNSYPGKCHLKYDCALNHYPADEYYLYQDGQNLLCLEASQTWADGKERTINKVLDCLPGCARLDFETTAKHLRNESHTIDLVQFKDTEGTTYDCFTRTSITYLYNYIQQIIKGNNKYFCNHTDTTEDSSVTLEQSKACLDVCIALDTTKLPPNVVLQKTAPTLRPYNEETYVGLGKGYEFGCAPGYEYKPGSKHSAGQKQKLTCTKDDDGQFFVDEATNEKKPAIAHCQLAETCPPFDDGNNTYNNETDCKHDDRGTFVGCKLRQTCKKGYYPAIESERYFPSKTFECDRDYLRGGVKWFDMTTKRDAEPLNCIEGCLETNVFMNKSIEVIIIGTTIQCPYVTEFEGIYQFFCNDTNSKVENSTISQLPCTHSCPQLDIDSTLTHTKNFDESSLILGKYVLMNNGYNVSCPAGQIFANTKLATKAYVCGDNATYHVVATDEYDVLFVNNTCVDAPLTGCGEVYYDEHTQYNFNPQTNCNRQKDNTIPPGCLVQIECITGGSFNDDVSNLGTTRRFKCAADGFYESTQSPKIRKKNLDYFCIPTPDKEKANCTLPTEPTIEVSGSCTTTSASDCKAEVKCKSGFIWATNYTSSPVRSYTCTNDKQWKNEETSEITPTINERCTSPCVLPPSTKEANVTLICDETGCKLIIECGEGYAHGTESTITTVEYLCDGTSKNWVTKDTNITLIPGNVSSICVALPTTAALPTTTEAPPGACLDSYTGANVDSKVACLEKICTYELQCKPGYVWNEKSSNPNPQDTHFYVCKEDGKYVDQKYNVSKNQLADACIKSPSSCATTDFASDVIVTKDCNEDKCSVWVQCAQGSEWDIPTQDRNMQPIHNYTCEKETQLWVDVHKNKKYKVILDQCESYCPFLYNRTEETPYYTLSCWNASKYYVDCNLTVFCQPHYKISESSTIEYKSVFSCNQDTGDWTNVKNILVTPAEILDSCPKEIMTTTALPVQTTAQSVKTCIEKYEKPNLVTDVYCKENVCKYDLKCKGGFVWNEETRIPNNEDRHYYMCFGNGTYIDQKTNTSKPILNDECVEAQSSCPTPVLLFPTHVVKNESSNCDDNLCSFTLSCDEGQRWDEPTRTRNPENIHKYECGKNDKKWTDTSTKVNYKTIEDKCEPNECPLNHTYTNETPFVTVICEPNGVNKEFNCTLTVFCNPEVRWNGESISVQYKRHFTCDKNTATWIDTDNNSTISVEDMLKSCPSNASPTTSTSPGTTPNPNNLCIEKYEKPNVDSYVKCDQNVCKYELKCKGGFVWNEESNTPNNDGRHVYMCFANGTYVDEKTNISKPILNDDCVEKPYSCPVPEVTHPTNVVRNISSNCDKNSCSLTISCYQGQRWDEPTRTRNPNKVHEYECDKNEEKWMDKSTNIKYNTIDDKCEPDEPNGCPLNYTYTNETAYFIVNCKVSDGNSEANCTLTVFCDPVVTSNTTSMSVEYKRHFTCDKKTGTWRDDGNNNTEINIDDMTTCNPNKTTTLPSTGTTSTTPKYECIGKYDGPNTEPANAVCFGTMCSYQIKCKKGYVWNEESFSRNPDKVHAYICYRNNSYYDEKMKKSYPDIIEACIENPSMCPVDKYESNVIKTHVGDCDKDTCAFTVTCPEGQQWDSATRARNNKTVHTYSCESEKKKWKDTDTMELFDIPTERCEPYDCPIIYDNSTVGTPFFRVNCINYEGEVIDCTVNVYCGPYIKLTENGTEWKHTLTYTCNKTTKTWFTEWPVIKEVSDELLVCPDNTSSSQGPTTTEYSSTTTPGSTCMKKLEKENITAQVKCDEEKCTYEVKCEAGYVWNDETYNRNPDGVHWYTCYGNNSYIDNRTNTVKPGIEDGCVAPETECSLTNLLSNLLVTRNPSCTREKCTVSVQCYTGEEWDNKTSTRNPTPVHTYECLNQEKKWKDVDTNEKFDTIGDKCIAECKLNNTETKELPYYIEWCRTAAGDHFDCATTKYCDKFDKYTENGTVMATTSVSFCESRSNVTSYAPGLNTSKTVTYEKMDSCDSTGTGTTAEVTISISSTKEPETFTATTANPGSGTATTANPGSGSDTTANPGSGTDTTANPGSGTATTANPGSGTATTANPGSGTATTANPGSGTDTTANPGSGTATTANPGAGTATTENPGAGTATTGNPGAGTATTENPGAGTATTENPGAGTATTGNPGAGTATTENPGAGETTSSDPGATLPGGSTQTTADKEATAQTTTPIPNLCMQNYERENVDSTVDCLESVCRYDLQCKLGFVWNPETNEKNAQPRHLYHCYGNGTYFDVATNRSSNTITDDCIPSLIKCNKLNAPTNVEVTEDDNCDDKQCSMKVKCQFGNEWDTVTMKRNNRTEHNYECVSGEPTDAWKDKHTQEVFIDIPDRCIPIPCKVESLGNTTEETPYFQTTCFNDSFHDFNCETTIYCAPYFVFTNAGWDIITSEKFTCNKTTKTWKSNIRATNRTFYDLMEICNTLSTTTFMPITLPVTTTEVPEIPTTKALDLCMKEYKKENVVDNVSCEENECMYQLKCKDGFIWNPKSEANNPKPNHVYLCYGNGTYFDVFTNLGYEIITDDCIPDVSSCTRPTLPNNVEMTETPKCDAKKCSITLKCQMGNEWDSNTMKRNNRTEHNYDCIEGKPNTWKDLDTKEVFSNENLPDRCEPITPCKKESLGLTNTTVPYFTTTCFNKTYDGFDCTTTLYCAPYRIFTIYGYDIITEEKFTCNSTTKEWISNIRATNSTDWIQLMERCNELLTTLSPTITTPSLTTIKPFNCLREYTKDNVNVKTACLKDACLYELECKKDFMWNHETSARYPEPIHLYTCPGNSTYFPSNSHKGQPSIEDDCIPNQRECPTFNISSTVELKEDPSCNTNKCIKYTKCPIGQMWAPETQQRNNNTEHAYECVPGGWKDKDTQQEFVIIPDRCEPITCKIQPLNQTEKPEPFYKVSCYNTTNHQFECNITLYCISYDTINVNGTTTFYKQEYTCDANAKTWNSTTSDTSRTEHNILEGCGNMTTPTLTTTTPSITTPAPGSSDNCTNKVNAPTYFGICAACNFAKSCNEINGAAVCGECAAGYEEDPTLGCINYNECSIGRAKVCALNAKCEDRAPHMNDGQMYRCNCRAGYKLKPGVCENECEDIDECLENGTCGANQKCQNNPGSYSCSCQPGYIPDPPNDPRNCIKVDPCSKNNCPPSVSKCIDMETDYECLCLEGYIGNRTAGCLPDNAICTKCDNRSTECHKDTTYQKYKCNCKPKHDRIDEFSCKPVDPCLINNCAPQGKAECVPINDGYDFECKCLDGFYGNGTHCYETDICKRESPCLSVENTHCVTGADPSRNFHCECNIGYVKQVADLANPTARCYEENGPTANNCSYCDPKAEVCADVIHSDIKTGSLKSCNCRDGYFRDKDFICKNIDECSLGTHNCDPYRALCIDQDPSVTNGTKYSCNCFVGFTGDGTKDNCKNINECEIKPLVCQNPHQICVDKEILYECQCETGYYVVDQYTCGDIDECEKRIHNCGAYSSCLNTEGGYNCTCNPGFQGSGTDANKRQKCEDVDECLLEASCNSTIENCMNTLGSYQCNCKKGYEKINGQCEDKNECLLEGLNLCDRRTTVCLNTAGSYECPCLKGYVRNKQEDHSFCENFNECLHPDNFTCHPNSHCLDTLGSYECKCEQGYRPTAPVFNPTRPYCERIPVCGSSAGTVLCNGGVCVDTATEPFFRCECPVGTIPYNNSKCIDQKYCDKSEFVCPSSSLCLNGKCECTDGFKWKELGIPYTIETIKTNRTCNPIDWCVENRAKCLTIAANCRNTGPGTGECYCMEGYQMIDGNCEDINECINSTACGMETANLTKCENTLGGYECSCMKGYKKKSGLSNDGTICENIDECKLKTDNCTTSYNNTLCKDTIGGFSCECKPGYKRDQIGDGQTGEDSWAHRHCIPIKYCENKEQPQCDSVAQCIDHEGYAECICPNGYVGSGVYPDGCRRLVACREPTLNNCSATQHEICVDLPAPSKELFKCDCVKGFRRVDGKCEDIDECAEETDNCSNSKFARCENRPSGTFTCVCIDGYRKNQTSGLCEDIDECLVPSACPSGPGDICIDLPGSHNCSCAPLYEKPKNCPVESHNKCKCVQIDVCAEKNPSFCGPNTHCSGLGSNAVCVCIDGFTVTPPKTPKEHGCEEETDLCKKQPCLKDQTCTIIAGVDRQCHCNNGSLILDPITQECIISPCDKKNNKGESYCSGGVCSVRSDGTASCTCPLGYKNENPGTPEEFCSEIDVCKCGERPYPCPDSSQCKDPERMLCARAGVNASCSCLNHFKYNENTGKCDETDPCTPNPCENAVLCTAQKENGINISAVCICPEGQKYNYVAKICERDPAYCIRCDKISHGKCNNGSLQVAKCECEEGYRMNSDGTTCQAIDPCEYLELKETPKVCKIANEEAKTDQKTQTCECSCRKGYQRNRTTEACEDIDECVDRPCYLNTTVPDCLNTLGSYECTCNYNNPEWTIKNGLCEMIDKCPKAGCDAISTICKSPEGECLCRQDRGYSRKANATHCEHVNACFEKTYDCPKFSKCVDGMPSYKCECIPGYIQIKSDNHPSGHICLNVDECLENPCPTGSDCTDTEGSFECKCLPPLIQKNSKECIKNSTVCTGCPSNSHCIIVVGGKDEVITKKCNCNNGFIMNNNACDDVDECDPLPCGAHANCTNVVGSYRCDCQPPYQGNGKEDCKPIDYCKPNPCPERSTCLSTTEKQENGDYYQCTCTSTGYKYNPKTRMCEDIDECIPCFANSTDCPCPMDACDCLNTQGSYECGCQQGFYHDKQTNTCKDIDECLTGEYKTECPTELGVCKNTEGSWNCICNKGFKNGDAFNQTCIVDPICGTPLDTCNKAKSSCRELGAGEFTCDCKDGYQPSPTVKNQCIDKDECLLKEANCLHLIEKCENKEGNYDCVCSVGYEANKDIKDPVSGRPRCDPLLKCEKDCPLHSSCYALRNNTSQCICHANYEMIKTEKGDDACMISGCKNTTDCPPNSKCVVVSEEIAKNNTALVVGSTACFCIQPFVLDDIRRVCKLPENICETTECPAGHRCLKTNVAPGFECVCEEINNCKNISCADVTCRENEVCRLITVEYPIAASCICKSGFYGSPCKEIDSCVLVSGTCSGHAKCTNGTCVCNNGYYGNGTYCANRNECTELNSAGIAIHDCDPLAKCYDTDGSYYCQCIEGYTGSGRNGQCKDIDECDIDIDKCDKETTICNNTVGSYNCECIDGYRNTTYPYITCLNINECSENKTICGIHRCTDLTPGYECNCNLGYEHVGNDKTTCKNIDECLTKKHDCSPFANCNDTEGSFTCECKNNYEGNGRTCNPIDKCANPEVHRCSKNTTICEMKWDIPTFVCKCLDGFEPPKQVGIYTECNDKNECTDGSVNWNPKTTTCTNTIGSYELECNTGYVNVHENASIHNIDCKPRDECGEDPAYKITLNKISELQMSGNGVKEEDWKTIMVPPQKLDSGYRYCYEIAMNNWIFGAQFTLLPLCQNEEPSITFIPPSRVTNGSSLEAVSGFSCTCMSSERKKEEYDTDIVFSCGDRVCHCPSEFICVRGNCECPDGLIKYLDENEGKTTCVERECTNSTSKPSEIEEKGKTHLVVCQNDRWMAVQGYRLIKDPVTKQITDVIDIDECSESASICCSASANCTGPLCVSCLNTAGSYECLVKGGIDNKTGICESDKIKKDTCECTELKCTDQQSWYWSCVSECRSVLLYDFSKYSNREVCTRFSSTSTAAIYMTLPSLKTMYERICASKMEISNKFGCLYDTNPQDLTKSPVFNYWGPCLTSSSIEKVVCATGSAQNISSAVFCPINVSEDYPINNPISQPIGVPTWPKQRSCESTNLDFFKNGAWRITENSNSAAILDLKPR